MSAPVRVELRLSTLAGLDDSGWAAAATAAAKRLVDSLALPVEPSVTLERPMASRGDGAPSYSLEIGGTSARLAWNASALAATVAPPDPELRLHYDLARNAELFVTEAVAEEVRTRWATHAPEQAAVHLSPPDVVRLLRGCVHMGRRVERVLEGDPGSDERDPLWWRLLEGALDSSPSLRFVVPSQIATLVNAHADLMVGELLADHVYEQTGVILPTAEVGVGDGAGDGWSIEVCDISIPIPAAGSVDTSIEQLPIVLRPWLHAFVTRETTRYRLGEAADELPHLVNAVRARFGDAFITRSLRALVEEGVTVNDFRSVLGGLAEIRDETTADEETRIVLHAPAGTPPPALVLRDGRLDPEDAADCVRRWERRAVTLGNWNAGTLHTRLLAAPLEASFRTAPMVPGSAEHQAFLGRVVSANEPLLTNVDVRRRVFEAIAVELPHVSVLCYQELLPETNIIPVGSVGG